jgi:large subunit ribosomal protein L25
MELKIQTRNILGKKVETLRQRGLIPAELYGHGIKNLHLSLSAKDFQKVFKEAGESTIVNLITEDNKKIPVMILDVVSDPISEKILSVDFYQIKLTEKIKIPVPIEFIGEAPAVKNFGGILVKPLQEIEVEAFPQDLPRHFQVDLSPLDEIKKSILVKDLKISDKVKISINPEMIVATVIEAKPEEEEIKETVPAEGAATAEAIPVTAPAGPGAPAVKAPAAPKTPPAKETPTK